MKKNSIGILALCSLFLAVPVFAYVAPVPQNTPLTSEDIATLAKPSIVMVDNRTDTDFVTDVPSLDLNDMTINSVSKPNAKAVDFDFDTPSYKQEGLRSFSLTGDEGTGSGFIVNSNGYIVTNAHVASSKSDEYDMLDQLATALIEDTDNKSSDDVAYDDLSDSEQSDFQDKVVQYLIDHTTVTKNTSTLTVLNPSVVGKNMDDAVAAGFPATIVKVNDNYLTDGKDIALIKIDAQNLPSILLSSGGSVGTGSDVYVFGFPATATITATDYSDATFSRGVINAAKEGPHHLPVYQTDAKISSGSSGSPLLDANGTVIGMVTYGTTADSDSGENGDGFAYALPISMVTDFLSGTSVAPSEGVYYSNVLEGINYMNQNEYRHALAAFALASDANTNNASFVGSTNLDQYRATCNAMIAAGRSQDTPWEQLLALMLAHLWFTSFIVLLILLLIFNFVGDGFLFKRIRADEKKIEKMEEEIIETNKKITPVAVTVKKPVPPASINVRKL